MTPQELSDTIGAIYDCALEPERWPVALKQVGDLCGAPFTFVVSHDLEKNLPGRTFRHGGQDEWMDLYCGKYAKYNPIPTSTWLRPIGEVYSVATLFSDEEWLETRFYKEFMEPGGLLDIGGLMALRSGKRAVWMGSMRTKDQDRFSPMDMQTFQLLSPHICRTVKISHVLDLRTLRSDSLESALNALSAGVFLLDRQGRVVYKNTSGDRCAKTGNALRIVNGRFSPTDHQANAAFTAALSPPAIDPDRADPNPLSIGMPSTDGEGLVATILPIDRGFREDLMAPWSARWAVFVQNPTTAPQIPGEAFAKLYNLTGAELRVVLAVAKGLGAKEAADILGLGEATVRTHLQRTFEKTGTTRQTELIPLLMASAPPVRP